MIAVKLRLMGWILLIALFAEQNLPAPPRRQNRRPQNPNRELVLPLSTTDGEWLNRSAGSNLILPSSADMDFLYDHLNNTEAGIKFYESMSPRERITLIQRHLEASVVGQPELVKAYQSIEETKLIRGLGQREKPEVLLLAGLPGTGKETSVIAYLKALNGENYQEHFYALPVARKEGDAWKFFQDAWSVNVNVYQEYSYLVKKLNFRLAILPLVKILSSLLLHLVFIVVVTLIVWVTDGPPTWHILQLLFYIPMLIFLLFGVSWLCSTLNVFFRDVGQMVGILTQIGFWATPIIWKIDSLPERYRFLVQLNPIYFIVEGYRKSLIYHEPIFDGRLWPILYYLSVSSLFLVLGLFTFRRLKSHFMDVL